MPTSTIVTIVGMLVLAGVVLFVMSRMRAAGGAAGGGWGSTGPTEADRLLGPDGPKLRAAVQGSDVSVLNARLLAGRGNWDERGMLVDLLGRVCPRMTLDAWCQSEPGSPIPFLMRGTQSIEWAWEARGSGGGDTVTEEGWRLFAERLTLDERDFQIAAQLDPADPTPFAMLVLVARGLDQGVPVAREMFQQAVARDPENSLAHKQMLVFLTEKWHGSHETMFQFAREAAARAPDGSDLHALVIRAHVERWIYFKLFDGDAAGAAAYASDAKNQQEVAAAWEKSLGSPALRERMSTIVLHNDAAFWFWNAKDRPRLQREIQRIGNAYTEMYWHSMGAEEKVYGDASRWAFGVG